MSTIAAGLRVEPPKPNPRASVPGGELGLLKKSCRPSHCRQPPAGAEQTPAGQAPHTRFPKVSPARAPQTTP